MILIVLLVVIKVGFKILVYKWLVKPLISIFWTVKQTSESTRVEVDEGLGSYWNSLPGSKQKAMYAKEVYSRHHLNIRTMDDACLERLRTE